ncbi:MAG: aldo/keto reductase [Bacteroidales bacterium]
MVIAKNATGSESENLFYQNEKKGKIVTRKLGKTGMELPVVSFGVMRADNPNLIKAAMGAGIKHFDTAYVYQNGNNEKMLGEVLEAYPRDSFTIATKVKPEKKKGFLEKLDASLERLKMDYVDILYVHAVSSREDVLSGDTLDALITAKDQGKALHIGLSTHSNEPEVIKAAIDSGVYEVILTAYNFKQDHKDLLAKRINEASEAGIGIVAMKTMAGGKLGKDAEKMHFQAALKWSLKNSNVHTTIPGITTFKELEENLDVMNNLSLTKNEEEFLAFANSQEGLYCNGCQQCINTCNKRLPIPDMMRAYMYAYGYGEMNKAKQEFAGTGISENPCTDCSICTASCIKGFNIPEKLADISRITTIPADFLA